MIRLVAMSMLVYPAFRGEVIDRVAVAFERKVITESAIRDQIRVAAFLNEEPVAFDGASKRKAAEQLLEQALIRSDMELSRYALPADAEIPALLEQFRKDNYPDAARYRKQLEQYGITEAQLGRTLLSQAAILRFIELRFRQGIAVSDFEVETYYKEQFVPNWRKKGKGEAPGIDESRTQIEEVLAAGRVDKALDEWLQQAREQARVRFIEEVFR